MGEKKRAVGNASPVPSPQLSKLPVPDWSVSLCLRAQEGSLRADPIVDVEFEGSMFKVAQLLDKIPLSAVQEAEGGKWALVSDGALYDQLTDAMH